jgi:hypothetical protein
VNPLVESLGPVFIAGFALQQLLELASPLFDKWGQSSGAWVAKVFVFGLSLAITLILPLRALRPFGITSAGWLDALLTALLVSSGTAWLDDLLKIIRLKKLEMQARAQNAAPDRRESIRD